MLGLLGLSGSLPLFLCFRGFSFFYLATPHFSCYRISPCIFPLIFPRVQMFLFDLFMSDTVSECPAHFLWEHSVLISLQLDAYFLQLCSPTQLLQYIVFFLSPEFVCSDVIFFLSQSDPFFSSTSHHLSFFSFLNVFPLHFFLCNPL